MLIGNETREIKAKLLSYEYNVIAGLGSVLMKYYYELKDEDGNIIDEIGVHTFSYQISEDVMSEVDKTGIMQMAVDANPLP